MRWLALALLLIGAGVRAEDGCQARGPTASHRSVCRTIEHGGMPRAYRLFVPPGSPQAVVFLLHGAGGSGAAQERIDGGTFLHLAECDRFLLALPDGIGRQWNDGRERRRGTATDDVGFLLFLLDHVRQEHQLPEAPAFVAGMSNGGMMTYRLACEAPDRFRAAAAVVANMSTRLAERCRPSRPIPFMVVNGTADPLMPYGGGTVGTGRFVWAEVLSTEDTVAFWARTDGCAGAPATERRDADGFTIATERRSRCRAGSVVSLIRIEGGGHAWPGGIQYLPEAVIGRTVRGFDASAAIWDFFRASAR